MHVRYMLDVILNLLLLSFHLIDIGEKVFLKYYTMLSIISFLGYVVRKLCLCCSKVVRVKENLIILELQEKFLIFQVKTIN